MSKEELLKQIETLEQSDTLESYNKIIEIIDKYLKKAEEEEKQELEEKKWFVNIKILKLQLEQTNPTDYKKQINLRGKLISTYKKAEKVIASNNEKIKIRYEMLQELKQHKEIIKTYRKDKNTKLSLPKKVGLNILEISKSIEIFLKEKDILTKAKNVVKETAVGTMGVGLLMGGVGLALQSLIGLPLTLSTFVSACPVIAYIGLSSIIRNISTKTAFQQYIYQQSDEYKALVKEFNEENKEQIKSIAQTIKEKQSITNIEDLIAINEQLIEKLDMLANSTKIRGVRDSFALQALSFFRENKEYCEQLQDDYLEEKNDDVEKYNRYKKKLSKIKFEIFKRGNSINDAIKDSGKSIAKNTAVMLLAKSILSCVAPNVFNLNSLSSVLEPFAFAVINGLIDIPTYRNKLKFKETEYQGKIQVKNKKRIEEILEMKGPQPSLS